MRRLELFRFVPLPTDGSWRTTLARVILPGTRKLLTAGLDSFIATVSMILHLAIASGRSENGNSRGKL